MIAYVLLSIAPLIEHEIYLALCRSNEVDEVFPLFGEYDIILKLTSDTKEGIGEIVERIKTMKGVLASKTLTGY